MRFEIDPGGTARARRVLADDPDRLRRCSARVSDALVDADSALASAPALSSALARFRLVEARALDAVADAAAALGGRIDTAAATAAVVERSASAALASVAVSRGEV